MTKLGQHVSSLAETTRLPPPQMDSFGPVQVVETPIYTGPPQPTIADVLKALQDLGQKIHQVSKNQQSLEGRLESLKKRVDAVHHNGIVAAEWLRTWDYCLLMNIPIDGPSAFVPTGVNEPHWK